jgi:hypothetical protein
MICVIQRIFLRRSNERMLGDWVIEMHTYNFSLEICKENFAWETWIKWQDNTITCMSEYDRLGGLVV